MIDQEILHQIRCGEKFTKIGKRFDMSKQDIYYLLAKEILRLIYCKKMTFDAATKTLHIPRKHAINIFYHIYSQECPVRQ